MIPFIEARRAQIADLCQQYHVRCLEVFGSATGERFDPKTSDLDFLVEFMALPRGRRADAYFGLLEGLQELFQRPVDLIMLRAITNPYFQQAIEGSRQVLYAA